MERRFPSLAVFAGIASLGGIILTVGALVLTRIAWKMTGAPDIFVAPELMLADPMRDVWGLFLAINIVKVVLALTFTVTFWFVWLSLPLRGRLVPAAVALATLAGLALTLGFRLGVRASAWLSSGIAPEWGPLAQQLISSGMVCAGLAIALLGVEGQRIGLFQRWMPGLGLALAVLGVANSITPLAGAGFAILSLAWWAMLLPPLLGSAPRTA